MTKDRWPYKELEPNTTPDHSWLVSECGNKVYCKVCGKTLKLEVSKESEDLHASVR